MKLVLGNVQSQAVIGGKDNLLPFNLYNKLKNYLSIKVDGYQYSPAFKRGGWDGMKYFITADGRFATGFVPSVLNYLDELGVDVEIEDTRTHLPKMDLSKFDSSIGDWTLRDYQESLVKKVDNYISYKEDKIYFPRGIIDAATNAGKNSIMAGIVKNFKGCKALMLIHNQSIFKQAAEYFETVFDIGKIDAKNYQIGTFTVAMQKTLLNRALESISVRNDLGKFDILFVDECFVPDSLIDGIKIKDIKVGDKVRSYNHSLNKVEYKKVIAIRSKPINSILKVTFSNGVTHYVTENHPYWSINFNAYVEISKLNTTFVLSILKEEKNESKMESAALYGMQKIKGYFKRKGYETGSKKQGFLFRRLQKNNSHSRKENKCEESCSLQQIAQFPANERKQSNEESSNKRESFFKASFNKAQAFCKRRKWTFNFRTAINSYCVRMANGSSCANKEIERFWLSNQLQIRCRKFNIKNWFGNRWKKSWKFKSSSCRFKKNVLINFIRVENIEILKQGYSNEFERVCPKGFVYNVEVEDNNNYFVNNILVHNCHLSGGKDYARLISMINAPIRVLVSGTPLDTGNKLNAFLTIGLSGDRLGKISNKELIEKGVSLKPKIHFVHNKCRVEELNYDQQYSTNICLSKIRVKEFVDCIEREGIINNYTLVAFSEIKHGEFILQELLADSRLNHLVIDIVHGTDKQREEKLSLFKEGKINILIGSTIMQEGLNIPIIQTLCFALAGKAKIPVKQFIGRALRTDGISKSIDVIDFYDNCKWLADHSRTRIRIYKEEEFEIKYHYTADAYGKPKMKF